MLDQLFISDAAAQASEVAASQSSALSFLPLIAIFAIFYFLIVRPQTKKMKEHNALIQNLKVGNKIIINSGIIGVIEGINEKESLLEVEISDGVHVKILKDHVARVLDSGKKSSKSKAAKSKSKKKK